MATVLAIANQKGGVGKTTSAVNLSAALAMRGNKVLLIDLDAQASATQWLLGKFGPKDKVVRQLLLHKGRVDELRILVKTGNTGFDLIASDLSLARIDIELAQAPNSDGRVRTALQHAQQDYDYVMIDTPPSLGQCTYNAFVAAEAVLIPVDCGPQAFDAMEQLLLAIEECADAHNRPIGVFTMPTFFKRTIAARGVREALEKRFPNATLPPIGENVDLDGAYATNKTIFDYKKTAPAAMDYVRVAKELEDVFQTTKQAREGTRQTR